MCIRDRFQGDGWIRSLYFFILISHILLSVIVLPMVLTTVYFAASGDFTRHPKIARITLPLWLYVSVTGVLVYLMLYHLWSCWKHESKFPERCVLGAKFRSHMEFCIDSLYAYWNAGLGVSCFNGVQFSLMIFRPSASLTRNRCLNPTSLSEEDVYVWTKRTW